MCYQLTNLTAPTHNSLCNTLRYTVRMWWMHWPWRVEGFFTSWFQVIFHTFVKKFLLLCWRHKYIWVWSEKDLITVHLYIHLNKCLYRSLSIALHLCIQSWKQSSNYLKGIWWFVYSHTCLQHFHCSLTIYFHAFIRSLEAACMSHRKVPNTSASMLELISVTYIAIPNPTGRRIP